MNFSAVVEAHSTRRTALATLALALWMAVAPADVSRAQPTAEPVAADGTQKRAVDPELFPLPEELEDAVDFWFKVYTQYPSTTKLLHDELHLGVVYAALDFSKLEKSNTSERRKREIRRDHVRKTERKYRSILDHLAKGTDSPYPEEQRRVELMFGDVPGGRSKYTAAKSRFRTQTCLRDHFSAAIERSGIYMSTIEQIFRAEGLPVELTRLPFVESMFQWKARSSAAAGGIWQFVPSTARAYLEMTAEYDQRYDPLVATKAAARFLGENHRALDSWPLAVTAYNHGRYGMKRAAKRHGTDIAAIVKNYRSRTFGFASRNFYAEFLAAARVYHQRKRIFPGVEPLPPLDYAPFEPAHYVPVPELVAAAGADADVLRAMNPAISREVWSGDLYLPKGYELRVPSTQLESFQAAYDSLPGTLKTPHQMGLRYRVRPGDSLSRIASRYGTSASAIQRANGLRSANRIRAGQVLLIPPKGGARFAVRGASTPASHVVQRGESLSLIASRYGTSVAALQKANGLRRPDNLQVGQRLTIPAGGAASSGRATHTVRSGETLAKIARRYGTTVAALQRANRLSGHIIQPSQVLVIP
ncbi:MAG: LysM peptidoglycan-binding domain-containing protein [Thermoanaerobaculia bacterium]|nr:LysM peptidoglycan-binding domain-containing protein [Thermoanaerobaculia bacterium]